MKYNTRNASMTIDENRMTDSGIMSDACEHFSVFASSDATIDSWINSENIVYTSMYSTYSVHVELNAAATAIHGVM